MQKLEKGSIDTSMKLPGVTTPRQTTKSNGEDAGDLKRPTPEEQELCYGTLRVCPRAHLCNLAAACISRANEDASAIHYHRQNISVPFMRFDSSEANGSSNGQRRLSGEKSLSEDENVAQWEAMYAEDGSPSPEDDENAPIDIGGMEIAQSSLEDVRKVTDAICALAINSPETFKVLVSKIYHGSRQIDIARREGKSRQAVNKRLLAELGIAQRRDLRKAERERELSEARVAREEAEERLENRDADFASLSVFELLTFKMLKGCGMRENEVAAVLGVTERTVFNVRERLLKKHAIRTEAPARRPGGRRPRK